MITPEEIVLKATRYYLTFLQSWLRGEAYTPLYFPVGKLPTEFVPLRTAVQRLQGGSKAALGYGYTIESQQQQKRSLNQQTLPTRIVLETAEDFLRLLGKCGEFQRFQQCVALIRERVPQLEPWLQRSPKKILEHEQDWPNLLKVCLYFLEHPRPGLYIRELPINVHTKFVEERSSILRELLEHLLSEEAIARDATTFQQRFGLREEEPFIYARFLDDQLRKCYGLPLDELAAPRSQFACLDMRGQRCLITENKMTFLTLPRLAGTFALWGGGFKASGLVALPWLVECPLFYWGDLDAHGFQILSQLRAIFPHVISLMMDEATFTAFSHFCVPGTSYPGQHLDHLTAEEHALFVLLARENLRLEQEHISHDYVLKCIHQVYEGEPQQK